ncbi:MAG: cysteine desulfurase family protein [Methyloligellaceae bacterium]
MTVARTYLDHNATSPMRPEVREQMLRALECSGNPSSVHTEGRAARALVEEAREKVAALVDASANEIIFTSGATEANNMVFSAPWTQAIVTAVEHDSVLSPVEQADFDVKKISVAITGVVSTDELFAEIDHSRHVQNCPSAVCLSLQMANSETGIMQPVDRLADSAKERGLFVHSDAVQAAGKVPLSFRDLGVDALSLSAHKFGGPKGIGALVLKTGAKIPSLLKGGSQENRKRAGTENIAAIAGFGCAAECARAELDRQSEIPNLRDALELKLVDRTSESRIIGAGQNRLPNTSCLAYPGKVAETLVIALDLAGFAVSAGSACSSGKIGRSHVLEAMNVSPELADSAIRVSMGWNTTPAEIDKFVTAWEQIVFRDKNGRRAA